MTSSPASRGFVCELLTHDTSACEQIWVADITYLPTADKFVYLSLVTDAYSRKIVGWHVHDSLETEQVSQALKMALSQRRTDQPLVHHSDRGIQYCSAQYQRIHARHRITCSMTDGYDCYQNALAERVNGILKMDTCCNDLPISRRPAPWWANRYGCTTSAGRTCP